MSSSNSQPFFTANAGLFQNDTVDPTVATDLQSAVTAAYTNLSSAQTSATDASNSASAAATSANNASASASTASTAESSASSSASSASNSATNASTYATNSSNSASSASTSATNASNSASAASTSATNAANSATSAGNSASAASTSATNAANSATSAANSATQAAAIAPSLQYNGSNGDNVIAPTAAITLTNAQSGSIIQPAATAAITVTLPSSPVIGVNYEFIGYGYVTTVVTGTTSVINIPGLAGASSATVPVRGNNSLFVFWHGNAWEAWTRGQVAVENATASNQAVALGQVQNAQPISAASFVSGTALSVTTPTFTAPSSGVLLCQLTSTNTVIQGTSGTGLTTSLAGFVVTSDTGIGSVCRISSGYLPMTSGQSTTVSGSISFGTTTHTGLNVFATFIPLG